MSPRVVIGVPLYNGERYVEESLGTLLGQTFTDLALVLVDDASTDGSPAIAQRIAGADPRVTLLRNDSRLGMVGNWRRAFDEARRLHPDAEYFAWGSDHDLWHPHWLASLVAELDAHPEAVLAWSAYETVDELGGPVKSDTRGYDSAGIADPVKRLRSAIDGMSAGNMIYGLMRAEAVARARSFPPVLLPDRLLLAKLAVLGEFRQVPGRLWRRRVPEGVLATLGRQRRTLFVDTPRSARLPWWRTHATDFEAWVGPVAAEIGAPADQLLAVFTAETRRVYREAMDRLKRKRQKRRKRAYHEWRARRAAPVLRMASTARGLATAARQRRAAAKEHVPEATGWTADLAAAAAGARTDIVVQLGGSAAGARELAAWSAGSGHGVVIHVGTQPAPEPGVHAIALGDPAWQDQLAARLPRRRRALLVTYADAPADARSAVGTLVAPAAEVAAPTG